jgi:hypothetical protein
MCRDKSFLEVNAPAHREHGNLKAGEGVATALEVCGLEMVRLGLTVIGIVGRVGVGSMQVSVDVAREMLSRRVACRYCSGSHVRGGMAGRLIVGESCDSGRSTSTVALSSSLL